MKNLLISAKILLFITIITGILYPLFVTGVAQILFQEKANGSFVKVENQIIGSELIGQKFTDVKNFWGRPSAIDNNPMPSGASNLSTVGEMFKVVFLARIDTIRKYHGNVDLEEIPKDLLFASASGVDPHISPNAAYFQIDRISKARNFNEIQKIYLRKSITNLIESPDLYFLGESKVNVLKLNLILAKI